MNKEQEGWEHQESVDDKLIEGDDFDTEVVIYQNKPYPTINAYYALATKLGMTIDEVVEKETDTEWVIRAKATWTANDENNTIMHRWGGAADKKSDKHGYAKAWGKAQRNAFKGFLRGHPEMKKAINEFMESGDAKHKPDPRPPKPAPEPKQAPPPQQNQTTTPRIRASQALARNKDKLEQEYNIPAKTLADATVHHYGVNDLDSLPDSAWKEVEVYLNTSDFGIFEEWISAMRADDQNHPKGE